MTTRPKTNEKLLLEQRQGLRKRIDAIDVKIMILLNRRAKFAGEIGRIKSAAGSAIVEPEREAQVLRHVASLAEQPLTAEMSERIFRSIMLVMRDVQREVKQL
jgi:chorismate mutase-like protein